MDFICKSVSKPVLCVSEHMAALPSSAGPIGMGASALGPGLGLGLGLALAVVRLVLALMVTDLNEMMGGRNCTSLFLK